MSRRPSPRAVTTLLGTAVLGMTLLAATASHTSISGNYQGADGAISGIVVYMAGSSANPAEEVTVALRSPNPDEESKAQRPYVYEGSTQTDGDGYFSFPNLPPGDYFVRVSGFDPEFRPVGNFETFSLSEDEQVRQDYLLYTKIVVVSFNPLDHSIHVTPDALVIVPGQEVIWRMMPPEVFRESWDIPHWAPEALTVHFSPLSPLLYRSRQTAREGDKLEIIGRVRSDILPGKYSYLVAVTWNGLIYTEDPELIDENGDDRRPPNGGS